MLHFCTYFNCHYLPRGLALYHSLRRHCPSFRLWVLCLDSVSYEILAQLQLASIRLIHLEDFERDDAELLTAKQNRSMVEYFFTCTPSLPLYLLKNHPEVEDITYLDADLFFFADPSAIYEECTSCSVGIIEHRFPYHSSDLEDRGRFNVGWIFFRRTESGLECLRWWRQQCIEWCYDRVENGRYADQKYLDQWPDRFRDIAILRHKGANLAPWNIANYRIHCAGDAIWVDDQPLVFFHFQGLKQITGCLYDPNFAAYGQKLSGVVRKNIYAPYLQTWLKLSRQVQPLLEKSAHVTGPTSKSARASLRKDMSVVNRLKRMQKAISTRNLMIVLGERAL